MKICLIANIHRITTKFGIIRDSLSQTQVIFILLTCISFKVYFYSFTPMKPASISNLKKEVLQLPPDKLAEYCIRLAKYKVENKELLNYLLFQAYDQEMYIEEVKKEVDLQFKSLNKSHLYLAKKTIRKALKTTHKYIKFSDEKTTELELLIYFCKKLKATSLRLEQGKILGNMYIRQFDRIKKVLGSLHEDLQLDYADEVEHL